MSTIDETEKQYTWAFEYSPVALFVEDYTLYVAQIDAIRRSGVTDLHGYLDRHPEALAALAQSIRVIDGNRAALAMFGAHSKEELLGSLDKIFVLESAPVFRDWTVAMFHGAHEHSAETVIGTVKGERRYLMITITLLPLEITGTGRRTLVSCTDITAQKRAEDALAANEKLYRTLFESIPHPIWMGDAAGRITYYNQAMAEITGMPDEQAMMRDWVDWVHEDDRGKIKEIRQAAQEHGNAYSGECRFRTASGLFRNMYFIDTPVKDDNHVICQWVGIDIDITELKEAHDDLQRALDRSNDELAQFAYAASHDLQEPLRMVTSYMQLLRQRYADSLDERANKYISYAVEGSKRIRKLILDVLALSNVNLHGKPFRLLESGELVDEVIAVMGDELHKNNAVITHERLPTLRADAGQLRELFHCLFSNSIKFRGAEDPRVHVSARRTGSSWLFTVEDNGKGFDSSLYGERVFQMFQRLHTRDQYPGTGIGLTMAKKIIERHGGRIWVESHVDQGARFFFILPAADLEEITIM